MYSVEKILVINSMSFVTQVPEFLIFYIEVFALLVVDTLNFYVAEYYASS